MDGLQIFANPVLPVLQFQTKLKYQYKQKAMDSCAIAQRMKIQKYCSEMYYTILIYRERDQVRIALLRRVVTSLQGTAAT